MTTCAASEKLRIRWEQTGSLLSVGLEPATRYLPEGFGKTMAERERFLKAIIDACAPLAAAFKFNLAHFESLGSDGWKLLEVVRSYLPRDVFIIVDGKRNDIGSSSEHYAFSAFERLNADAATVNPLMGHDAVEPFLQYPDRMTFLLALTSNPGANDFLMWNDLYLRIAERAVEWNSNGQIGLVTGATHSEHLTRIRSVAPGVPFLIPGIGAQSGDLEQAVRGAHEDRGGFPGFLVHVTRGLLPPPGDARHAGAIITERAALWQSRISDCVRACGSEGARA